MSIFSEIILPKILEIPKSSLKALKDEYEVGLKQLMELEDEYFRSLKIRERVKESLITTLQSIDEDEDEQKTSPEHEKPVAPERNPTAAAGGKRRSNKRSKDEVDGIASPEVDKRQKRNASVKAQTNITKQAKGNKKVNEITNDEKVPDDAVNVNLSSKLRRESPGEHPPRRAVPPPVKIKQEKVSIVPQPEEPPVEDPETTKKADSTKTAETTKKAEPTYVAEPLPAVIVKQERITDMPPPSMPAPKRGRLAKQASQEQDSDTESESRRSNRSRKPKDLEYPAPERGRLAKQASQEQDSDTESESRRSNRSRKPKDLEYPAPVSTRSSRASSRASSKSQDEQFADPVLPPPAECRPKRTRTKKKLSESSIDAEKENTPANISSSPADKPRPKRTRRGQKAIEAEAEKRAEPEQLVSELNNKLKDVEPIVSPKYERPSIQEAKVQSPEIQQQVKKHTDKNKKDNTKKVECVEKSAKEIGTEIETKETSKDQKKERAKHDDREGKRRVSEPITPQKQEHKLYKQNSDLDKRTKKELHKQNSEDNTVKKASKSDEKASRIPQKCTKEVSKKTRPVEEAVVVQDEVQTKLDATVTLNEMNSTMVLPNAVYNHAPVTPQNIREADATVVLERCERDTIVLNGNVDATIVLHKGEDKNLTEDDDSVLTDDVSMEETTPTKPPPKDQPTSAVKQKVQQFEQLAARTTRTKTRQLEAAGNSDHTPPGGAKSVLTADTLDKLNTMIFNAKPPMASSSASKPRAQPPPKQQAASASKASALSRQHEESVRLKETARQKKEALLEAKREQYRKKREEKIAAAAMAREAAERERRLAMEAAERERQEKQAQADMGKMQRKREMEKKKQEQARKAAETEERRRQDEKARQLQLQKQQEEQRRQEAAKKKQLDEEEALKKEAALLEKRQKEYLEKQQKIKHGLGHTPLKSAGSPLRAASPTYMADGFQYLTIPDEEEPKRPKVKPSWCESKMKNYQLSVQSEIDPAVIHRLYPSVPMSVDLREIFPGISRQRIVRTSSAVWRTPPNVDGFLSRSRIESAR